jgi:hypothetical protein
MNPSPSSPPPSRRPPQVALALLLVATPLCCRLSFGGPPPPRNFQVADLFLPEESLPEDWNIHPTKPYEACSASPLGSGCPTHGERVTYTFRDTQQWVSETIFVFLDKGLAAQDFDDALSTELLSRPDEPPWEPIISPPVQFAHASRQHVACRTLPGGRECGLAAQYEEFVVIFMARPAHLDDSDLQFIVGAIDHRMVQFLGEAPPPTP